jgi:hypothetical protein
VAEASDRLLRQINATATERMARASASRHHDRRTPRAIVNESLISTWSAFLETFDRTSFQIGQQQLTALEHYRRVSDVTRDRWRQTLDGLSSSVLSHALAAGTPARLDDLFMILDNQPQGSTASADTFSPPSLVQPSVRPLSAASERESATAFVDSPPTGDAQMTAEFRRVVLDFAERYPESRLQDPHRILEALREWTELEITRGVGAGKRKLHRAWIRRFLVIFASATG